MLVQPEQYKIITIVGIKNLLLLDQVLARFPKVLQDLVWMDVEQIKDAVLATHFIHQVVDLLRMDMQVAVMAAGVQADF